MGWGRMLLLGNLGQQLDIEEQRQEIQELRSRVRSESRGAVQSIEVRLDILERQSDEMKLYLAALVRYLAAKGQIDLKEFGALVEEYSEDIEEHRLHREIMATQIANDLRFEKNERLACLAIIRIRARLT